MSESTRPGVPQGTRLALGYGLIGPLILAVTGSLMGALLLAVVALVSFVILRPGSYRRSAWRATGAALWLAFPSASLVSASIPLFDVMENRRLELDAPDPWVALWLAGGFLACIVLAIRSALPVRSLEGPVPPGSEGPTRSSNAWRWAHLGLVLGALASIMLGTGYVYMVSSLFVSVSRSHIAGNAPAEADFDRLMKRDLEAWFVARDSTVSDVDYELLRKQPTQAGIAPPKYYVWITAHSAKGAVRGAARVMALERVRFEVTDFLTSTEILARPDRVGGVFPARLTAAIVNRARNAEPREAAGGRTGER